MKIIRKRKTPQEGTSSSVPSIYGNSQNPSLETPVFASHSPGIPSVGVSISLKFGSVLVDFSPLGLGLEGERFETPVSPDVASWFRPRTSENIPTSSFTTPPPIRVVAFTEGETSVPFSPITYSPNP
jgi:hypothetical protein